MKSVVSRAVYPSGPIVDQIVIILDLDRERSVDHNRVQSQQITSVRDERIRTYMRVQNRPQSGTPNRDERIRLTPHRGIDWDNPAQTYVLVYEQNIRSCYQKMTNRVHIASMRSKLYQNAFVSKPKISKKSHDQLRMAKCGIRNDRSTVGTQHYTIAYAVNGHTPFVIMFQ